MLSTALTCALLTIAQDSRPTSRPASQPSGLSDRERMVEADWDADAPGEQVMRRGDSSFKFLPVRSPQYTDADGVADRVRKGDLVIGLVAGGQAFAYPINMLGGPQREIVNDEFGGVAFCVNW